MAQPKPAGGAGVPGLRNLKRAFVDGAVILLPVGAIVLLTLGIVHRLQDAAHPLAGRFAHPLVVAVALLLLLCLAVGFLVRSALGRWTQHRLERLVFERVPGYRLAKAFATEHILVEGDGRKIHPALVAIEDGQCPAFVMDEFADGRLLVFVPGSPAPMAGALYIFSADRVTLLDVPLMPFMQALSAWGLGLREMLEAEEAVRPARGPAQR